VIGAQLPSLPMRADGSRVRILNSIPDAVPTLPTLNDSIRPTADLSPGGRALLPRCDVPPRSQPRRGFGPGAFIRVLHRAEFGDHAIQDCGDAFHSNNYGASNGREAGKNTQGVGNVCRSFGN